MDNTTLEHYLAHYCAATLLGEKSASLVSLPREECARIGLQLREYNRQLGPKGLVFTLLCACRRRLLLLVYRPAMLERELAAPQAAAMLEQLGYPMEENLRAKLNRLQARFAEGGGFPHEIGLFLEYPPEDVRAFVATGGAGCKLCGYWKVYHNVEAARACFARYDACRAGPLRREPRFHSCSARREIQKTPDSGGRTTMSKIAVIYWSGTGNTEQMAQAVAEGAQAAGAQVETFTVDAIDAGAAAEYSKLALGCPAMGAEVLEESEFEPWFSELEGRLSGHQVALFGSYGWGDGQWLRDWAERTEGDGAALCGEPLAVHEAPDDDALAQCKALGEALAKA